jgi:hypothetical protein
MSANFRHWLARKLLSFVNALDRDCKIMCDQREHWMFKRGWNPEVGGGEPHP